MYEKGLNMLKKDLNRKINRLYRQLGKEVYQNIKSENTNEQSYKKFVKKIDKNIKKIEKLIDDEIIYESNSEHIILEPHQNEDGLIMYTFCKKCHVGNNPESTHCIGCGEKLD
jgi:Pyruvate/2-oxoacid:ferredoxin oxidoreductase delta subunit